MKEQNNNQPEQNAIRERISKHLREIEEQHHICTAAQIVKYKKTQSHIPEGKQKCGFESSC